MKDQELVNAIRRLKVETGSLTCMGCGHEHNCGVSGCAIMREAADRIANQSTHIAALQQEIEKLRGQNEQLREAAALVTKESAELLERRWIPVEERLPEDRSDVLVVAYWHERWGAYMGAGALPKGRHGLSMSALGTDPISPSRTGCRCRNRRRRKGK